MHNRFGHDQFGRRRVSQVSVGALIVSAFGLCLSPSAFAQTAASPAQPDDKIQEVVVTALRTQQTLQDAPASVTVITADTLQNAGVRDLEDVANMVPNFDWSQSFRVGVVNISMRGIDTPQGGEPPVALVVDGVQTPGLEFVNQDLLNISSVQVLRGPQGALYGRGAIAGAVIVTTQEPTDDWTGKVTLDYGNGNTSREIGTIAGPIVPGMLWVQATVLNRYTSGLIQDPFLNEKLDFARSLAGRLEILAKPDDLTTIDLRGSHSQGYDGASYQERVTDQQIYDFSILPEENFKIAERPEIDQYSVKIDRDTPIGTLTSVTQFAHSVTGTYGDADWTPAPIAVQYNPVSSRAVNQDLRLSGPSDATVQWLVGFFFQRRDDQNYLLVTGQPGGPLSGLILDYSNEDASSTAFAGYGQAVVPLPYDLQLTGALRYDVDQRYDNARNVPGSTITADFYALQPKLTLSKKFTDDVSGYIDVGRGFRSGGFNAYLDAIHLGIPREFPKETADNYEIGVKTQWLDHHLSINADFFHTEYKNQQFFFVNISPPSRDIVTFPQTVMNGGEVEVAWKPAAGLTITDAFGVTDGIITSSNLPQYNGNHTPFTHNYDNDLSVEYRHTLWQDYDGIIRVDYHRYGNIYYDQTGDFSYDPTNFVNGRIGIETDFGSLAFFGRNITNQRAPQFFSPDAQGLNVNFRIPNQPRTYGVELTAQFSVPHAPAAAEPPPVPTPAPAAPASAPAVEAKRSFQVFFDFDKSNITDAAAKVIQSAADAVKAGNVVQITVTGHTDTVGTAAYNQGLSERRAAAVKGELVKDRVAGGEITTVGVGKTGLLVPTADGVREPQNRRAEIVLQ